MAPPDFPTTFGIPAGYGRSCTNCSRAKCKCILRTDGSNCERCHRLGKDCQPMASTRKRVAKKPTSTRTAQLEEKLDDLVSILRASQQPGHQSPSAQTTPTVSPSQTYPNRLDSLATAATATPPQPNCGSGFESRHGNCHGFMQAPSHANDRDRMAEPSAEEAEVYLNKFRSWLNEFPFMYIPADISAKSLRQEKPFLWLCIMNITTMSVPQQTAMKEKVRREAAQRVVVDHERTMDVLLGLTCYIAWASMNAGPASKPFLITYTQLAATILYEMGLTRSPAEEQYFTVCFKVWSSRPSPPKLRTMEERRAVLSLWCLTSICTSFIGKMDTLRWTPHMEECLDVLSREKELPQDETLVTLVNLQLICEDAQKLLLRDVMGDANQTPTYVFKKGMMVRLQAVRDGMSASTASIHSVQTRSLGTEMLVQSVGLFMRNIPDEQRIDSMYSCLRAVRGWYDIFFSIPLIELPALPFAFYVELFQTQVALYRLTTSEDPAWDKEVLRNTADVLNIIDRTVERFLQVGSVYPFKGDEEEGTLFVKGAKMMRNIRSSWEPALAQHLGGLPTPNSQVVNSSSSAAEPGPVVDTETPVIGDPSSLDFADLAWMTDIFGPWEF